MRILEIDVNELKNNIKKIKKYCGKGITIMPIIKANAYGTYINQNIDLIKDFEIVGVANSKEGEFLRKIGFENEIFILNQPYEEELETIFENDLIIGISSKEFVKEVNKYNKLIKVHLEIETGMGRTGIFYDELDDFINSLGDNIKVEGIYTHFSCADTNIDYTEKQLSIFNKSIIKAEKLLGNIKYKHAAASNGILNIKNSHFNMIRPGIILYGYESCENLYAKIDVKPIAKLKCRINYIKEVEKGESISYGGTFITNKKTRVATIPIGYGDGIRRQLSNKGNVVINGKKAKILGTVCMDSIMVDISEIENVKVGDYAYIWDNQNITLEEIAKQCDTINYEILCNISSRVERKFL
ncbi:MAG: alanine racemase [Candidatus Scatovivens sp.]